MTMRVFNDAQQLTFAPDEDYFIETIGRKV
jgi:hypothetical protein